MGDFIKEKEFVDYGNVIECRVEDIGGWEYLDDGRICVFFIKRSQGEWVLDHPTIMSLRVAKVLGSKLLEIAARADGSIPCWASCDAANKIAS